MKRLCEITLACALIGAAAHAQTTLDLSSPRAHGVLPTTKGGTGYNAASLAALKTYLGIGAAGAAAWGQVTGDISTQNDLVGLLGGKAATGGSNATGTWPIGITGNAATATTARGLSIPGVPELLWDTGNSRWDFSDATVTAGSFVSDSFVGGGQDITDIKPSALTGAGQVPVAALPVVAPYPRVYNVRVYGATGDGTTDDTAAIQAAITAASAAGGGLVWMGAGTYRVSQTLNLASHITLAGEGPRISVLRPDTACPAITVYILGTSGTHITDVRIDGIGIDGSQKPAVITDPNGFGRIYMNYADRIQVNNSGQWGGYGWLVCKNTTAFQFTDLWCEDVTEGAISFLDGCEHGVVNGAVLNGVGEALDFFEDEDILCTNIWALCALTDIDEAVDWSSSRHITISDSVFRGWNTSIRFKTEGDTPGAWAYEDCALINCQILDFASEGVSLAIYTPFPSTACKDVRIENCTIKSAVAGAVGIIKATGGTVTAEGLLIAGNTIEVPSNGIWLNGGNGTVVRGNRVTSGGSSIRILADSATSSNITVAGNVVATTTTTATEGGIVATDTSIGITIYDNQVLASGGTGIWLRNLRRPQIAGNVVSNIGGHGIYLQWSNTTQVDATNKSFGAVVDRNVVTNWGATTAGRAGILLTMSPEASGTYGDITVCNNRFTIDGTQNTQIGVQATKGTMTAVDYARVSDNLFFRVPTPVSYAGVWGANSIVLHNAGVAANLVLAGPASGGAVGPTYRSLVAADLGTTMAPTFGTITALSANLTAAAPATQTSAGTAGEVRTDASYLYRCTTTGADGAAHWKRVALDDTAW